MKKQSVSEKISPIIHKHVESWEERYDVGCDIIYSLFLILERNKNTISDSPICN